MRFVMFGSFIIPRFHQAFHSNHGCIRLRDRRYIESKNNNERKDLHIAYTSRLFNKAEQNYSTIEKELFAIIYSVQFFPSYIYGRKFTLTDI